MQYIFRYKIKKFVLGILILSLLLVAKGYSTEPLKVYLFASSTCEECRQLKEAVIPEVLAKYKDKVIFEHIAVDNKEMFELQLLYEEEFEDDSDSSVKLFVGTQCLAGVKAIKNNLDRVLSEEFGKGTDTISPDQILAKRSEGMIKQRFSSFSPILVASAGLIDGVNPCAFVTLVFFISVLSLLKKSKKEILFVGLAFSIVVFLTYLLLGIGVLHAVKIISVNAGIAKGITVLVGIIALILAFFSFLDCARYYISKKSSDISLKLPKMIRNIINRLISSKMRTRNIVFAAIGLGVMVSLLESMCTGQVYLPTIMYVLQDKTLNLKAISYLILYNLMFIVPLLIVFLFAYIGISSQKITALFTRNIGMIKFLMGLLFLVMGSVLIYKSYVF
ncbi:MAG: hypothetical protein ABII88_07640 [Candidatus Omnitrophota bacterium]